MRITTSKLTSVAVATGFAIGVLGIAGPASAAPNPGETVTTFTIEGGTLDVSVPVSANLGTVAASLGSLEHQLGTVTVVDDRAAADASWIAAATTTGFTTGAGTPSETVGAYQVDYASGPATATTGTGTYTPGGSHNMDLPVPAFTHTGGTGRNTAAWDPSISVELEMDEVAGTYTGVITHSVA